MGLGLEAYRGLFGVHMPARVRLYAGPGTGGRRLPGLLSRDLIIKLPS